MTHDSADDFDHPKLDADSPLLRHVLYRLGAPKLMGDVEISPTPAT